MLDIIKDVRHRLRSSCLLFRMDRRKRTLHVLQKFSTTVLNGFPPAVPGEASLRTNKTAYAKIYAQVLKTILRTPKRSVITLPHTLVHLFITLWLKYTLKALLFNRENFTKKQKTPSFLFNFLFKCQKNLF